MNLIHTSIKLLAAAVFVLFVHAVVNACACAGTTPCQAAATAEAIFIGKVTKISSDERQLPDFIDEHKARTELVRVASLQISKVFRGISGTEIDLWGGNTTCDVGFKENETYLVFARRDEDGKWGASACSHTALLARAQEDLDYLRRTMGERGGTVVGSVTRTFYDRARQRREKPLARVAVNLVSASGTFQALTNTKGEFVVRNLPEGKYQISTEPATNQSREETEDQAGPRSEWTIDVPAHGCRTTWFSKEPEGGITGRVARADGTAAKHVYAYLIPVGIAPTDENTWDRSVDDLGRFRFDFVPPGRYYLGFNLEDRPSVDSPYAATYYPGVKRIEEATIVEVGVDQKLVGYDIVLTQALELRTIDGIAVWPDGRPAANVEVEFHSLTSGNPEGDSVKTDADGRFKLIGVIGQTYNLSGLLFDNGFPKGFLPQAVKIETTDQPVKFILRFREK